MCRIAAVLKLLTQLNKLSSNNLIRHECQNGICGGCFFILFDGYIKIIDILKLLSYNKNKQKIQSNNKNPVKIEEVI